MERKIEKKVTSRDSVVVRFAGDSGDGMQIIGSQFTASSALSGNDVSTLPDFPAEIRAPQGTLPGVSGFQIHFGSKNILTPGDIADVLVAMNPAALKVNLSLLKKGGTLIVNRGRFSKMDLKKAGYETSPLDDEEIQKDYHCIFINMNELVIEALKDSPLMKNQKLLCKNFFALGIIMWMYDRDLKPIEEWLDNKFKKKPEVLDANQKVLRSGYYFGETTEMIAEKYVVKQTYLEPGVYRKITGNEAISLGLATISRLAKTDIVFGAYPITPASDIITAVTGMGHFGIKTAQMEDEIASIGVALGASYGGALGFTATSGPGVCLQLEFLGLALITELPLVLVNVQRGGPSTGLPTKTEQSDLLQAMFGRHGEGSLPVLAPASPSDCFNVIIEAGRIALETNTPVIVLSECYLANGAEPWKIPSLDQWSPIKPKRYQSEEEYIPYRRDPQNFAREIAIPGTPGLEHRLGGLEKDEMGQVSYDPMNHEHMVRMRAQKVAQCQRYIPPTEIYGCTEGDVLVLGWGGTYGAIRCAVDQLLEQGYRVAHAHIRYINPLPEDLGSILKRFHKVLVPELNMGQLALLLRAKYLKDIQTLPKVQGQPFTIQEIFRAVYKLLKEEQ